MMKMLKWFNIEKGKHTTKNYTVWKDTCPYHDKEEYEMYSYETLIIKGHWIVLKLQDCIA